MSGNTPVIKYRYKLPETIDYCATQSFGIEPYYDRDGKQIKVGKSIIRCQINNHNTKSCDWAKEAADHIVDLLNSGHKYCGPKTLNFDRPISVRGYFL